VGRGVSVRQGVCRGRRVCGVGHVPVIVVVGASVGGLTLERLRVTITIGVAEAATATLAVVPAVGLALLEVGGFNVGLHEFFTLRVSPFFKSVANKLT
jgi:hypothetical protein